MLQPYYFSISRSLIFQRIDNIAAMNFLMFLDFCCELHRSCFSKISQTIVLFVPYLSFHATSIRLTASTTEVQLRRNRRHSSKLYSINDRCNDEKLSLCVYAVLARLSNNATSSSTSEKDARHRKRTNDRRTPSRRSRRSAGVKRR